MVRNYPDKRANSFLRIKFFNPLALSNPSSGLAGSFGLIIVDLFVGLVLPAGLQTTVFWQQLYRLLGPNGYVLFNALTAVPLQVGGEPLPDYLAGLGFAVKELEVEHLNQLLILRK